MTITRFLIVVAICVLSLHFGLNLGTTRRTVTGYVNERQEIIGHLDARKKYAVFSTTSDRNRESIGFMFLLPLTVLAWKRIGFDSVVVVTGRFDVWNSDGLLYTVLSGVRRFGAVVVFLDVPPENRVMISQVSRIFAANILRRISVAEDGRTSSLDNIYMITSDADIWPINGTIYQQQNDSEILSLNSFCCGSFVHNGSVCRMLPMTNIGMKLGTWTELTQRNGFHPHSVTDIMTYMTERFGNVALKPVIKGDNIGWFLDQRLISVLVKTWINQHGSHRVKLIPRDVRTDRIDRSRWKVDNNSISKTDAHLLHEAYKPGVWETVLPLIRILYANNNESLCWALTYRQHFYTRFISLKANA